MKQFIEYATPFFQGVILGFIAVYGYNFINSLFGA
jgi:hypothetical protein